MDGSTRCIPVVLCVDVEPDGPGHLLDEPAPWRGAVETHRWLTATRPRIEAVTGRLARHSWFLRMDPQMAEIFGSPTYVGEVHGDLLDDVRGRGDALGVHVHGWRRVDGQWVDDFADGPWLAHCLHVSLDAFATVTGGSCALTRLGSRYTDPEVLVLLAAAGVEVDLTMEPARAGLDAGVRPHVTGPLPDYRRTPRGPHRVGPGLTELPLSASRRRLGWHPKLHLSRMRRHGPFERLDVALPFGRPTTPGETFADLVDRSLRHQRRPHLVLAVRSDSILDPAQRLLLEGDLAALLDHPAAARFAFTTPQEALAALAEA